MTGDVLLIVSGEFTGKVVTVTDTYYDDPLAWDLVVAWFGTYGRAKWTFDLLKEGTLTRAEETSDYVIVKRCPRRTNNKDHRWRAGTRP